MVLVLRQHKIVAQSGVWMVAFADESQVVAGYHNGDIRWWKIDDEQQYVGTTMQVGHGIASLECGHSRKKNMCEVYAVDISSDGTKVAFR